MALRRFVAEMFTPFARWWLNLLTDTVGIAGFWSVAVAIGRKVPGAAWLWGVLAIVLAVALLAVAAGVRLQAEKDSRLAIEFKVEPLRRSGSGLHQVGGQRYKQVEALFAVVENLGQKASFTARIRQVNGLDFDELPGGAPYEVERVAWEDTTESQWPIVRGGKGRLILWRAAMEPIALWAVTAHSASYGDGHLAGWRQHNFGDQVTFRLEVVNVTDDKTKVWAGRIEFNEDRSIEDFTLDPE